MAQPAFDWQLPYAWTEADVAALPDDGHRYEIFDGSLVVTPPAKEDHQAIMGNLYFLLRQAAPEGVRIRTDLGLRLGGANLVPDVVVLKSEGVRGQEWSPAADALLVVEIASRSTEMNDRGSKPLYYAEARIPVYWRIARDGSLHVYELLDGPEYTVTTVVQPGEKWTTDYPFPVTLDPAELAD
ncbi:Uma2 family endonuclease [Longispora sp. NPDC051575]|uniref:Uma2 family endonuclease n=1 Tax=Longispora sp. NPDC051575 TaxID=3154943 RepID=UPI0034439A8B